MHWGRGLRTPSRIPSLLIVSTADSTRARDGPVESSIRVFLLLLLPPQSCFSQTQVELGHPHTQRAGEEGWGLLVTFCGSAGCSCMTGQRSSAFPGLLGPGSAPCGPGPSANTACLYMSWGRQRAGFPGLGNLRDGSPLR